MDEGGIRNLLPEQLDPSLVYVIDTDETRMRYSSQLRVTGVAHAEGLYWFSTAPITFPIRIGGSNGWYHVDEEGVSSETVVRIWVQPLVSLRTDGFEQWVCTPRRLHPGSWTVTTEDGVDHVLEQRPGCPTAYWGDLRASSSPAGLDMIQWVELAEPLVTGLPAHLLLADSDDRLALHRTTPVTRIVRALPAAVGDGRQFPGHRR